MSEGSGRTAAKLTPSRWPGWVWAPPGAALLVVGYLVVHALLHPGVSVEVLFDTAAGVQPGQTRVAYHGLDMGTVKTVDLAPDGRRIRMKLFLKPEARPLLRQGTRFWIVGAEPSLTDIASLKTIFAGSSLEMAAGPGPPATRFVGQDKPPPVPPGSPGRRFTLFAETVGPLQEGASVYFHGLIAGKVVSRGLDSAGGAQAAVFVNAPYDAYVRPHSRFWAYQPLKLSGGLGGVMAQVSAPGALLSGGVAFDAPVAGEAESPPGRSFPLYADEKSAEAAPTGPGAPYRLDFDGAVGELQVGSAVRLRGFVVGRVQAVELRFDPATGRLSSPVTVAIEPGRIPGAGTPAGLDAALARLVGEGLQARLTRNPPLVGDSEVALQLSARARPQAVRRQNGRVAIPTVAAADLDALAGQASQVVAKADALPLAQVGDNLREITARLRNLTSSPKLGDSLDHLDRALDNVDAITTEARPEVGPLVASLRAAADKVQAAAGAGQSLLTGEGATQDGDLPSTLRQLTDAARTVRSLADYLDRHPEALLRGKRPEGR